MKNRSKVGPGFENGPKNYLQEKEGFLVVRSAASKTSIDLVALLNEIVILFQCKATKLKSNLPKKIIYGKKYKDLENVKSSHIKCVAYYSYISKEVRIFKFCSNKKSWDLWISFILEI